MRKDLEIFENRSDDWLAKQRAYEEKVSAWDFDEGKKIKEEHHKAHVEFNKKIEIRSGWSELFKNKEIISKDNAKATSILMFIISGIIMLLIFILSI